MTGAAIAAAALVALGAYFIDWSVRLSVSRERDIYRERGNTDIIFGFLGFGLMFGGAAVLIRIIWVTW